MNQHDDSGFSWRRRHDLAGTLATVLSLVCAAVVVAVVAYVKGGAQ